LPADQLIGSGSSGVKVVGSERTTPGGPRGQRGGTPGGTPGGQGQAPGTGTAQTLGPGWAPTGDLYIATLPKKVRVPEIRCPAVRDMGISGRVLLKVQVRRDGSVRRVAVTDGIGHGCDEIAKKALRGAKFKPAVDTKGKAADYELVYTYVFEPPA
jgi:protein TonB